MTPADTFRLRVYYEDTDASGVAYHANYLRWFERGRTEWLRARGYSQHALMAEFGVAFTVADLAVRYRRPARLDDELQVVTSVRECKRASLSFDQQLQTLDPTGGWVTIAGADVRVGCVRMADFMPIRMPDALQALMAGQAA